MYDVKRHLCRGRRSYGDAAPGVAFVSSAGNVSAAFPIAFRGVLRYCAYDNVIVSAGSPYIVENCSYT